MSAAAVEVAPLIPAAHARRMRWLDTKDPVPLSELLDAVARDQGLPDAARALIDPPTWAEDFYADGWWDEDERGRNVRVEVGTDCAEMYLRFERTHPGRFHSHPATAGAGSMNEGRVQLAQRHVLLCTTECGYQYFKEPATVSVEVDRTDSIELDLDHASVLANLLSNALAVADYSAPRGRRRVVGGASGFEQDFRDAVREGRSVEVPR